MIQELISLEKQRQENTISLIASENIVSQAVLEALGSPLTNKYSEGYPQKRYYQGNNIIDLIEDETQKLACEIFGMKYCNVQAYSGSIANMAVYKALLNIGDTVLGFDLQCGGHLSHGSKVNFSGVEYNTINYGVDQNSNTIEYESVLDLARKHKPKLIICGTTAYPRVIDFKKFKEIADEVGAYLLADISHISGLIITNHYPNPNKYADVVMSTTHKTLRGPRGALILSNDELIAKKINKAVFPYLQGGPHNNNIAAIGIALEESKSLEFKEYTNRIIEYKNILVELFLKNNIEMITGGSDTHLILIKCKVGQGRAVAIELESNGIIVNANSIPFDESKPLTPSGIRIGTASMATLNIGTDKVREIGHAIISAVQK